MGRDTPIDALKRLAAHVPLALEAIAMYYAMLDEETPTWAKAVIVGALIYLVAPDVIPDEIPVIGWLDDAAVIWAALQTVWKHIQPKHFEAAKKFLEVQEVHVTNEHKASVEQDLQIAAQGNPGATPVTMQRLREIAQQGEKPPSYRGIYG
jgi:uncharacterized membrane protein YkvA (DUF1232 family)